MQIWLSDELQALANGAGQEAFAWCMDLNGESVRRKERRHTFRVQLAGCDYFIKQHYGLTCLDIVDDLVRLRRPVLGAGNEYRMTALLNGIGIATAPLAGFGVSGRWPTTQRSFLITRALPPTCALSQLDLRPQKEKVTPGVKRRLIAAVAAIVAAMHAIGINHRDLYVNHFRLPLAWLDDPVGTPPLHLMDLHRAQQHTRLPRRWLVKDLAALLFSAKAPVFSSRDHLRFLKIYFGGRALRDILRGEAALLRAVAKKAAAMRRQQERRRRRAGTTA